VRGVLLEHLKEPHDTALFGNGHLVISIVNHQVQRNAGVVHHIWVGGVLL